MLALVSAELPEFVVRVVVQAGTQAWRGVAVGFDTRLAPLGVHGVWDFDLEASPKDCGL